MLLYRLFLIGIFLMKFCYNSNKVEKAYFFNIIINNERESCENHTDSCAL